MGGGRAPSIRVGAGVGATAANRGVENPGKKNIGSAPGYKIRVMIAVDWAAEAEPVATELASSVAPVSGVDGGGAAEAVMPGELISVAGGWKGTEGAAGAAPLNSHATVGRSAVEAAWLVIRLLASGGVVVYASLSLPARLRLRWAGVGVDAARKAARVGRFDRRSTEGRGPGAAGTAKILRAIARFLDARGEIVKGPSSQTARFLLFPPDAVVASKTLRLRARRPRPAASISPSMVWTTRSCLAGGVRCADVAAYGACSTFDPPGDCTAAAAKTPSGSSLNSICSVIGFSGVNSSRRRLAKSKISRTGDERTGRD